MNNYEFDDPEALGETGGPLGPIGPQSSTGPISWQSVATYEPDPRDVAIPEWLRPTTRRISFAMNASPPGQALSWLTGEGAFNIDALNNPVPAFKEAANDWWNVFKSNDTSRIGLMALPGPEKIEAEAGAIGSTYSALITPAVEGGVLAEEATTPFNAVSALIPPFATFGRGASKFAPNLAAEVVQSAAFRIAQKKAEENARAHGVSDGAATATGLATGFIAALITGNGLKDFYEMGGKVPMGLGIDDVRRAARSVGEGRPPTPPPGTSLEDIAAARTSLDDAAPPVAEVEMPKPARKPKQDNTVYQHWVSGGDDQVDLRRFGDAISKGDDLPTEVGKHGLMDVEALPAGARQILDDVAKAPKQKAMYRGIETSAPVSYRVGEEVDVPLSSFSADPRVADHFATTHSAGAKSLNHVIFEVRGGRGVDVNARLGGTRPDMEWQQELIGGGKYRVTGVQEGGGARWQYDERTSTWKQAEGPPVTRVILEPIAQTGRKGTAASAPNTPARKSPPVSRAGVTEPTEELAARASAILDEAMTRTNKIRAGQGKPPLEAPTPAMVRGAAGQAVREANAEAAEIALRDAPRPTIEDVAERAAPTSRAIEDMTPDAKKASMEELSQAFATATPKLPKATIEKAKTAKPKASKAKPAVKKSPEVIEQELDDVAAEVAETGKWTPETQARVEEATGFADDAVEVDATPMSSRESLIAEMEDFKTQPGVTAYEFDQKSGVNRVSEGPYKGMPESDYKAIREGRNPQLSAPIDVPPKSDPAQVITDHIKDAPTERLYPYERVMGEKPLDTGYAQPSMFRAEPRRASAGGAGNGTPPPPTAPTGDPSQFPEFRNIKPPRTTQEIATDVAKATARLLADLLVVTPQALKTTWDMSAPLRQGASASLAHPLYAVEAGVKMVGAWASPSTFDEINEGLKNAPHASLRDAAGVIMHENVTGFEPGETRLIARILEHVPGYARSQRAYATYLNVMRDKLFQTMLDQYGGPMLGVPINEMKKWANLINISTGRGSLYGILAENRIAGEPILWAPRLLASRFEMPLMPLTAFSKNGTFRSKIVAKEWARQMVSFVGINSTLESLAVLSSDNVEVETSPLSADFGQMKIGEIRLDPWAGYRPVVNLIARYSTGKIKSVATGDVYDRSRFDILTNFFTGKLSPGLGVATSIVTGTDATGEPTSYNPLDVAVAMYAPLMAETLYETVQSSGLVGAGASVYAFLGGGVNVYKRSPEDTFAQELGAKSFSQLSPTIREQYLSSHPQEAEDRTAKQLARGGLGGQLAGVREKYTSEQIESDKRLEAGRKGEPTGLDEKAWREDLVKRTVAARAARDAIMAGQEERDPSVLYSGKLVPQSKTPLGQYYRMLDEAKRPDGSIDFEKVDVARAKMSDADNAFIDRETGVGGSPTVKEYRKVVKAADATGLFDIRDTAWLTARKAIKDSATFDSYDEWRTAITAKFVKNLSKNLPIGVAKAEAERMVGEFPQAQIYADLRNVRETQWVAKNPTLADAATRWGLLSTTADERAIISATALR